MQWDARESALVGTADAGRDPAAGIKKISLTLLGWK